MAVLRYSHKPSSPLSDTTTLLISTINNTVSSIQSTLEKKVTKSSTRGLSENNYSTPEKNKLHDIEDGAEVNVQADWNETDTTSDSYILNKPNVPILDPSGLIPAAYLPSYVDDVLEYNSVVDFPAVGEKGKIYVDASTDIAYRWSGSTYIEISKSIVTGVKGDAETDYRIGNINLTAANIGLSKVVNLDLSKAIKMITRSGTTFTYTCLDGTTGTFTLQDTIYSLPLAANGTRGGILLGFTQSGRNYPVQLSGEKAYVNVPWTDTTYTLPLATSSARGGVKVGFTTSAANRNYAVLLSNELMYVNVPWTDTNTTYTFTDANPTLAWSTKSKVATVGGVDIHVTMPANPNTDTNTWRPVLCNGTSIGNNTLNLKAGSNVSLSNSNGAITITSTDTNTWPTKLSLLTNDTGYITGITKAMVTTALGYTPPTQDTNTWRGIQDNLTSSTNTTESLSAKQGYLLANGSARDNTKLPLAGGTMSSGAQINVGSVYTGSGSVYNGGIQLRERGYAGTSLDGTVYTDGPGITFHWAGRWAHMLNMHSNALYWDNTRISLVSDIPTSLPANGGNADTVDSEHAGAFAHRAAANNLVHAGNEITMIPDSFSGILWLNYQSVGRNSSSNITQYTFGNGKGGSLASITSGTFNGNCTGSAGSVAWSNVSNKPFNWSGQSGQPTWLWGSNDGSNYYVWNPSNFSVNYATSAGSVPFPYSSQSHYGSTTNTSYYKININSETSWMLSFIVRVYQGYNSYDIRFSGYNYGANHWYSPSASLLDSTASSITVYFGYDANWKLWVAVPGDLYSGVSVYNAVNGYTQVSKTEKDLFTVSAVNSLGGTIQSTQTLYRPLKTNEAASSVAWSNVTGKPTIPTKTSQLTNDSGYITSSSLSGYLPLTGGTLTGQLTISNDKYISVTRTGRGVTFGSGNDTYVGGDTTKMYVWQGKNLPIVFGTNGNERMRVTDYGALYIGASTWGTTSYKLYVSGNGWFEGNLSAAQCQSRSDLRLKDIQNSSKQINIEDIANAPIITFKWKNKDIDEDVHVGTSAQYWNEILPEAVSVSFDDYLSIDYGATALSSAITIARKTVEHEEKIKQLKDENKQLKEELLLLKSQIKDILAVINSDNN